MADDPKSIQDTLDAPLASAPTIAAAAHPTSSGGAVDLSASRLDEQGFAARYELGALLGQGGMGEVRLCRDVRIGRRVAVKRMLLGAGTPSGDAGRARFVREARVQAQLEHPAVVPVYDSGRAPDGAEFFTMKRVRGRTLADILDEHRGDDGAARNRSRRKLLTAFSSVCLAIHYAHTHGVLHRDLKPANLMLGDFGEVYVLDWGLAKVEGEVGSDEDRIDAADGAGHTLAGAVFGTPGFAAPEVLEGRPADPRADLYALGAILFEILTLEPLHRGHDVKELCAATLTGADARASARAPDRDVAPELEALCVRATALKPDDRPASARELSEAVERFLDGDRDLELRREQSRLHADAAAAAAARALDGASLGDRQRALREVGRALALDPGNGPAAATLVRLLTAPPTETPPGAEQAIRRDEEEGLRTSARLGYLSYASGLATIPLLVAMGIRSWLVLALTAALLTVAALTAFAMSRSPHPTATMFFATLLCSTAAFATASSIFSPYLIVPTMVVANGMGYAVHSRAVRWYWVTLICALGLIVPTVLEWAHVIQPTSHFTDGRIEILPHLLQFSSHTTEPMLLLFSLVAILVGVGYSLGVQRRLAEAQRRLQLHAWQLRQLIADQAK